MKKSSFKKFRAVISVFLSILTVMSLFMLTPVLAADGELPPCTELSGHSWETVIENSTCTKFGAMYERCKFCKIEKPDSRVGLSLKSHDVDKTVVAKNGQGEGFKWNSYKCKDCDFLLTEVLFNITDEKGNPVSGATVKIYDQAMNWVATSDTNALGNCISGYITLEDGGYAITASSKELARTATGAIAIAKGTVTLAGGSLVLDVENGKCSCVCHFPIIGSFVSTFFKIISRIFGRTIKCCDDMA